MAMSEMPRKIWAEINDDRHVHVHGVWWPDQQDECVVYIRADLAAEKDAEIERMAGLLRSARCPDYHCDNDGTTAVGFDPCGSPDPGPCQWCHDRREALAATEEKGDG
jgi:hypothetical protein